MHYVPKKVTSSPWAVKLSWQHTYRAQLFPFARWHHHFDATMVNTRTHTQHTDRQLLTGILLAQPAELNRYFTWQPNIQIDYRSRKKKQYIYQPYEEQNWNKSNFLQFHLKEANLEVLIVCNPPNISKESFCDQYFLQGKCSFWNSESTKGITYDTRYHV